MLLYIPTAVSQSQRGKGGMFRKPGTPPRIKSQEHKNSTQRKFICQREGLGIHPADAHRNTPGFLQNLPEIFVW